MSQVLPSNFHYTPNGNINHRQYWVFLEGSHNQLLRLQPHHESTLFYCFLFRRTGTSRYKQLPRLPCTLHLEHCPQHLLLLLRMVQSEMGDYVIHGSLRYTNGGHHYLLLLQQHQRLLLPPTQHRALPL